MHNFCRVCIGLPTRFRTPSRKNMSSKSAKAPKAPEGKKESKLDRERREVEEAYARAEAASAAKAVASAGAAASAAAPRLAARKALRAAITAFSGDGASFAKSLNKLAGLRIVECLLASADDADAAALNLGAEDAAVRTAASDKLVAIAKALGVESLLTQNIIADLVFVCNEKKPFKLAEAAAAAPAAKGKKGAAAAPAGVADLQVAKVEKEMKLGCIAALQALIAGFGANATPYVFPHLAGVAGIAADKSKAMKEGAKESFRVLFANTTPHAAEAAVPLLTGITAIKGIKYHSQVLAMDTLTGLTKTAPRQMERALPLLVPVLALLQGDMKKETKTSAAAALVASTELLENDDIKSFLPVLRACLQDPKNLIEVIHDLASTTFVQVLTAPMLAIVVPILLKGLKERDNSTKRLCGVIINNLVKLVESPDEVKEFIESLIDPIVKAHKTCSTPEARKTLEDIQGKLSSLAAEGEKILVSGKSILSLKLPEIEATITKAKNAPSNKETTQYCGLVAQALLYGANKDAAEWGTVFADFLPAATASSIVAACLKDFAHRCKVEEVEEEGGEDELCNCTFTLAYGTKVLLRNVTMRLKKDHHYGLLGPNDCGKTTLLKAITNEQVEGFPPQDECKAVFVEGDIDGEQSHLTCIDYILADKDIKKLGAAVTRDVVRDILVKVGFSLELLPSGGWTDAQTSTLSGGWRMKLALARAMIQDADVLCMDEPTNHLDVLNVAWVTKYMLSLKGKTSLIVSHDAKFLDAVCGSIIEITKSMGLKIFKGNLTQFVAKNPHAKSFFELKASTQEFTFPKPGPIEGVGSKGKPLMTMTDCTFTYPGNPHPTVMNITVRVSLSSRVACVGQNGAGKSTMIKLLTSEMTPQTGEVYKHPAARIAYVAQHAFHHIEEHLSKTAVDYILWRYQGNMDKENIAKPSMELTPEEEELQKTPFEFKWKDADSGKLMTQKRTVRELTGGRLLDKKKGGYEYEVRWVGMSHSNNSYCGAEKLKRQGWAKEMRLTDDEIALAASLYSNPLTSSNAEKFLDAFGLEPEFSAHTRIEALSDGQKVKVVIAGAMWNQPHIVILDEPTNYLDRDSLGALAKAIEKYDGGVVMITHNDEFCSALCPERWVLEAGRLDCQGDAEWMANALKEMVEVEQVDLSKEVKDASGNIVKLKKNVKSLKGKELKKRLKAVKDKMAQGEELDSDDEAIAYEHDL